MAKKLSKALRTDLNEVAALLRSKGRGRDTILAHINPEEAALLKARGGSGTINPETGLMEFEDGSFDWFSPSTWFGGAETPQTQPLDMGTSTSVESPAQPIQEFSPEVGGIDWNQFANIDPSFLYNQPQAAAPVAGGFGTAEPFVGAEQATFAAAPQFGAGGAATVTPSSYVAGQLGAEEAPTDKGALQQLEETMKKYPKTTGALESLLGTGAKIGLGYLGTQPMQRTQNRAAQESQKMADQYAAMGKPIQAMGYQQLAQAEAGQLTPAQQSQLAATRAQQKQALSRAGITSGTAQLQTEANLQRMANEFTQRNIDTALNMIQFGDKYVAQGIKAGYDANQAANQSANIFYQNLFGLLGGTGNVLRG